MLFLPDTSWLRKSFTNWELMKLAQRLSEEPHITQFYIGPLVESWTSEEKSHGVAFLIISFAWLQVSYSISLKTGWIKRLRLRNEREEKLLPELQRSLLHKKASSKGEINLVSSETTSSKTVEMMQISPRPSSKIRKALLMSSVLCRVLSFDLFCKRGKSRFENVGGTFFHVAKLPPPRLSWFCLVVL